MANKKTLSDKRDIKKAEKNPRRQHQCNSEPKHQTNRRVQFAS